MVADAILYHPTFTKLLTFLDAAPKREKLFRLVVYLSRFLAYYLKKRGYPAEWVRMFASVRMHVTFLRKGLRFLKPLHHLDAAARTFDNKLMDKVVRWSSITRSLGYAAYLTLDGISFMKMLGVVDKSRYPNIAVWLSRFWAVAIGAGIVNSAYMTICLNKYLAREGPQEAKADTAARAKLYAAKRKVVWDALDMFIALNALDYLRFSEGDIGLAGTVTSLMGLTDQWMNT